MVVLVLFHSYINLRCLPSFSGQLVRLMSIGFHLDSIQIRNLFSSNTDWGVAAIRIVIHPMPDVFAFDLHTTIYNRQQEIIHYQHKIGRDPRAKESLVRKRKSRTQSIFCKSNAFLL